MRFLKTVWKYLTNTNALQLASGKLEIYFFESVYRLRYFIGLSDSESGFLYFTYSTLLKSLMVSLVFCELWQLFSVPWNVEVLSSGTNAILIQFSTYYKYKIMIVKKDVFKILASSMETHNFDLRTNERKKILEMWQKRNESSLNLLLFLGSCTLIWWFIYPLLDDLEYNLVVDVRLPFKYQSLTCYPIAYMLVLMSLFYISFFVMSTDLMIQSYLMHLLCQYAVLSDCFKNILADCKSALRDETLDPKNLYSNQEFRKAYIKRLGNLVDQHIFILNNTFRLRDVMSFPMLAQLICSTVLICSIGFQVATAVNVNVTKWLMSLFYLGYNMFVQYVICRWCEEIKIQSELIGEALYCSGWEDGIIAVPGVRTSILLVLARAAKPVRLSAGGMYDLSLEAYATMVKTSYSALTVLLRLR